MKPVALVKGVHLSLVSRGVRIRCRGGHCFLLAVQDELNRFLLLYWVSPPWEHTFGALTSASPASNDK